jgi:hypothetical protein
MAEPLLFLSHAGVDSDTALRLVEQIEATPAACDHGLKVWIDKRDLRAGRDWQRQLEDAIQTRSTAFAVLLGQKGVINWVDREVRLGLTRAVGNGAVRYPFIPILSEVSAAAAANSPDSSAEVRRIRRTTASGFDRGTRSACVMPSGMPHRPAPRFSC